MRAGLAAHVEEVLEALVRDERRPRALALEQRVRRHRRAVHEALDLTAHRRGGGERRLLLPRRGRHLRRPDPAVLDQHGVRERPADVDAENPHAGDATAQTRSAAGVRRGATAAGENPGRRSENVVRPGRLETEHMPSCAFTIASTIASPSPAPPSDRARPASARANRSKRPPTACGGIPGPSSATWSTASPPTACARSSITPPGSVYLTAFSSSASSATR